MSYSKIGVVALGKQDCMSSLSQSQVKSFNRKQSKRVSKPQHGQPCHRLLPLKLYISELGPRWLCVITYRVSKSGFVKREGKCSLLIHVPISTVFSLFPFTTFFLSVFQFLIVISLWVFPSDLSLSFFSSPFIYGYLFLLW